MNVGRQYSVLGGHMEPQLLSLPDVGHKKVTLKFRRQDKYLPSKVLWSLLPLLFASLSLVLPHS